MYFGNHHLWWLGRAVGLEGVSMNDPAFPATAYDENGHMAQGMTLRDYFAAKAMQNFMHNFLSNDLELIATNDWKNGLASDSYKMADAMMKERNK
jgi:hypothetical protein